MWLLTPDWLRGSSFFLFFFFFSVSVDYFVSVFGSNSVNSGRANNLS